MTCAVMIKMMSNTRTTSTNGVTLISDSEGSPRERLPIPFVTLNAMRQPPFSFARRPLDHVQEFERKIIETVAHLFQFATEQVVKNRRRNRGNQANSGCHQSLGNT